LFRIFLLILFAMSLLIAPAAMGQADKPTIAILRFGPLPYMAITEGAILDTLQSYGFISADENRILEERVDHQGEHVNIIWGDAAFDFPAISVMVDDALDQWVDVLVTIGASVTLGAVNATLDMEDPPAILFTEVHNPYRAGIADAACIKPDHVTGTEIVTSYTAFMDVLQTQDPDISVIGTIYNTSEASGVYGVESIVEIADERGLSVIVNGVTSLSDLRAAADSLVSKGAEAIVLPIDSLTTRGLPIIVTIANESGAPVFYPSSRSVVYFGVTIGAGYSRFNQSGVNVGIMLTAYLDGEIDISDTGIHIATGTGLGLNLDSAAAQGVEIADELMQEAIVVIEDGRLERRRSTEVARANRQRGVVVPQEHTRESDMAFLASLQCTDAMIAEQQAALDAAGE